MAIKDIVLYPYSTLAMQGLMLLHVTRFGNEAHHSVRYSRIKHQVIVEMEVPVIQNQSLI